MLKLFYTPKLFLVCLLLGCGSPEIAIITEPNLPDPATLFTYLALGDSYTIGESVEEAARYPNQLADSLANYDLMAERVDIVARTGWRTDQLADAIVDDLDLLENYDLVSLLIGVNNQFQGRSIEVYEEEFQSLLEQAIDFADGDKSRVFVVSIPDYAFTTFGGGQTEISEGVDIFNEVNERITALYDITYFNITPISRRGLEEFDLVAGDGLHPSSRQYTEWVKIMIPEVLGKLEN